MLRLVPDAAHWRRLWSVQLMIIGAAFAGLSSIVPMTFGGTPWVIEHPYWFTAIVMGFNIGGVAGRLVDQPWLDHDSLDHTC